MRTLVLVCLLSFASTAEAQHVETTGPSAGYIGGGIAAFLGGYLTSVTVFASVAVGTTGAPACESSCPTRPHYLLATLIPLAHPAILADENYTGGARVMLGLGAILATGFEIAGVVMFVVGLIGRPRASAVSWTGSGLTLRF